ncbi:CZB domain-containing protein [Sulfurimonas sp. NW15]|uniref:CZB domain-containing protein n=1 Tax=unclassified Sulfurimonas TaxID=2623549 RepID=UPI003DA887C1
MTKEKTIDAMEHAREAHIEQMTKIKFLIEGKNIDNLTPVSKMKCEFGKWFYDDTQEIKSVLGVQFYESLDRIHEAWHIQYAKIHAIFTGAKEEGFFSKLFKTHKVDDLELEKAKVYYKDLEEITKDLLRLLETSKRRVQALSASKFS